MRMVELIQKKQAGIAHTTEELNYIVEGAKSGSIPDYQLSAWLMAVYFKGMTEEEIKELTIAMVKSGEEIDLSSIPGIKVDKHSTGGVGDTTTLILAPLVASAGVPVAKITGRGLGHTGGTLDKLASIPGMNVMLELKDFIKQIKDIGLAITGQTKDMVPADKKFYALRDVTSTIRSVPLIVSSIMSKKIAAGTNCLVLDVKVGKGAFMEKLEEARALAATMVKLGSMVKRKTTAIITDMNQPLGMAIGNALEVREAIEILQGEGGGDLLEVTLLLGAHMLLAAGKFQTVEEAREELLRLIQEGKGIEKLRELIKAQGGDERVVDNPYLLPQAKIITSISTDKEGYIAEINAKKVGEAAMILGAGREKKEDRIDPAVGIWLKRRVGDKIKPGDPLAVFYANDRERLEKARERFMEAYSYSSSPPRPMPLVYDIISGEWE